MSKGWKFQIELNGEDVWVYSLSEPPGRLMEISGPAASAVPVDLPPEVEKEFGYSNGNGITPATVIASADSGEVIGVFRE